MTPLRFSDRIGVTEPRRVLQLEEIDAPLRNSLWNWTLSLLTADGGRPTYSTPPLRWLALTEILAVSHFKDPLTDRLRGSNPMCDLSSDRYQLV